MIWMFAAAAAQMIQGGLQYAQDAKNQRRQNKADQKYNEAVRSASARQITEINTQRSVSRAQTAQALDAARRQGAGESSARNLQAAATDTMGASVEQNLQEVGVQLAAAEGNLMQNAELTELSLDSSVMNTVDQARNSIRELSNPLGTDWAATGSAVGQIGTSMVANKLGGQGWFGGNSGTQQPAPISQAAPPTRSNNLSTRLNV
ncbi:internal virion protein [Pectobacterium phage vB_PatP_CB5]|uniref:Putative internal virion protein n=3 Tax=Phimunavirus TaxID=2560202 RepID=A0A1P7WFW4_9CAUD|nr:internal virion protein [Pectobacterium phage Peat1]YP_009591964.1 internal virion protein [Pectobacterium phage PhiM1]YP_009625561.1 internal virion protein [Pectobacterium phage vB_PatP_CB5]AFQ22526.1 putative internal virion protein [Pectobacterium phage PhiM1]AKN21201.1 putative internal virion protein A [Pectobacterium phage Peat1]ARW59022.1 putative internal virion protein A [Pectobacterium phage vB_PatP_CB5]